MKRPPAFKSAALLLAIGGACAPYDPLLPTETEGGLDQGPLAATVDADRAGEDVVGERSGTSRIEVATDAEFPRATLEGDFGPAGARSGEAGVFLIDVFELSTGVKLWKYEIESALRLGVDTPLVVLKVAGGLDELGVPGQELRFGDESGVRVSVYICTSGSVDGGGWDQLHTEGTIAILEAEPGVWQYDVEAVGLTEKDDGAGWARASFLRIVDDELLNDGG